ncbi:MAG: transferrin-binding protein-like solute binding protein [Pseudomonadota bacterium]
MLTRASIIALSMALAACGGGGGSGGSDFTPTPAPTPTNDSLADLDTTETFPIAAAGVTVSVIPNTTPTETVLISEGQTGFNGGGSVRYDAAADSFTFTPPTSLTGETITVGPGDFTSEDNIYFNYAQDGVTVKIVKPDNTFQAVSYTSFGIWASTDNSQNSLTVNYALFGVETVLGDMPQTGSANYNGFAVGSLSTDDSGESFFNLVGQANFTANFSAASLTGRMELVQQDSSGTLLPWQIVDMTASIASGGNTFSGTTAGVDDTSLTGAVNGAFFGPAAGELGGTFDLSNGSDFAVGAFVGAQTN